MDIESAIAWYRSSQFDAADMLRATGLSERSQRELLKLGILQSVPQLRTATRLFDTRMLKRAALIYPLNKHGGFSLQLSGKMIYANGIIESLLFSTIDPWQAYNRTGSDAQRAEREWHWLTSKEWPSTQPSDYYVAVINGHYVAAGWIDKLVAYGHLTDDKTEVVVYRGAVWDELIDPSANWSDSEFHPRSALLGNSRNFKSRNATEADQEAIKQALKSPISKFSVNASLTLRMAMRSLLGIGRGVS
jgi:hypothetical protein